MKVTSGDDNVWPPGFRFHPTDEELILYYLKRKICGRNIKLNIIADTDVYKWHPEELPGLSKLKTGDRQWFFFTPRDRKYPNGARSNRATKHGYWKATGKDRTVSCDSRDVGVKKTLVFYIGRAPNGERTDWVMHEYVLDEEELNRCTNVQNYYVLYKLFKKSGPGPKNGEQYGAPFKEEDWLDDEFCGFDCSTDQETPVEKPNKVDTVIEEGDNFDASLFSLENLEELMRQIPDEAIFGFPGADLCANFLPQVAGQEESVITVAEPQDHILPGSVEVYHTSRQPCNIPGNDFTESAISQLQTFETCDATYADAANFCEQASVLFEDDFLEIDDLGGPEFTLSSIEKPVESLQFGELNGVCELDQFYDATMFLNDHGTIEYELMPDLHLNENRNKVANFLDIQFQSNLDCANANQINNQIPLYDQAIDGFTLSELQQELGVQQTSGVLCDPSISPSEMNQNQVGEDGSSAGRITSALWAFVESIPTTPASAAENARLNWTFDQMSSFRRRILIKSTAVSVNDSSQQTTRRAGRHRRFFLFSVLGAFFAIFCVFIGTVRIWERCISL